MPPFFRILFSPPRKDPFAVNLSFTFARFCLFQVHFLYSEHRPILAPPTPHPENGLSPPRSSPFFFFPNPFSPYLLSVSLPSRAYFHQSYCPLQPLRFFSVTSFCSLGSPTPTSHEAFAPPVLVTIFSPKLFSGAPPGRLVLPELHLRVPFFLKCIFSPIRTDPP